MDQAQALGILRGLLTALGGALVANGVINDGQLQTIVGALVTVTPIIWSVIQKWQQHAAVVKAAATGIPEQAHIASPISATPEQTAIANAAKATP